MPIFYVITASTKTNPDLFTTFGLWFSDDFHLWENLRDLFTIQNGIFSRWLWNTFYYATVSAVGSAVVCDARRLCLRQVRFRRQEIPLRAGARCGDDPADRAGDPDLPAPLQDRPAQHALGGDPALAGLPDRRVPDARLYRRRRSRTRSSMPAGSMARANSTSSPSSPSGC